MTDYVQVLTTTQTKGDARKIAAEMVRKRLAACAQVVGPIESTYWWKGTVETSQEWLCILKTRRDLFDRLEGAVREIHPYEVPEIIATPIVAGSDDYLRWLDDELSGKA